MKKSINWIIPLLMMVGLGLYGCTDSLREGKSDLPSYIEQPQGGSEDGEWIPYTMEFNASDMITPSLRALTEEQENDIQGNVRVLVFNTTATGTGDFAYEAPVTSVTPSATTADKKAKGKVQLLLKDTGTAQYKFVMLANLPDGTPSASTLSGKSYDDVMKLFTFDMPANGVWSGGDLPMWGEVTAVVDHNSGADPSIGTINLIRAVSRIDVGLNVTKGAGTTQFDETAAGITGIELTSVKFFNMNDKGAVAPAATALDGTKTKVTTPTIPTGTTASLVALDKSSEINTAKNLLLRSVYVPEAFNNPTKATHAANGETLTEGDQDNYLKRPYMVVGLKGADKSNKEKVTYFRIDFLKKSGDEATATYEYLHLLRNYRYLVNIQTVGGAGFDKEEDAMIGPAANIMYNVVVWNESELTDVKYDGQYMLGVSQDHFKVYRDGGTISAKVQTSWPEGIKLSATGQIETLPDWIRVKSYEPVDPAKNAPTDEHIITFEVEPLATDATGGRLWPESASDAGDATKTPYIQAGRMKWFLHFEQSKDINVAIDIFSDAACTQHLEFINIHQFGEDYGTTNNKMWIIDGKPLTAEQAGATVTFYVKTDPGDIEPVFTTSHQGRFKITMVQDMGNGVWKYTVTAPDITEDPEPFDNIVSTYDFSITHQVAGKKASAKLVLHQLEHNALPFYDKALTECLIDPTEEYFYLMDGKDREYYVKANTNYKIELISANANPPANGQVLKPFTTVEETNPLLQGIAIPFTPVDDLTAPTLYEGKAIFRISSPMGLFPTRDYPVTLISAIKQPEANTYMIKAGAKQGILIPVSRVNTAADYYDRLLNHDAQYGPSSTNPYPLPGNSPNHYRLNRLDDDDDWLVNIVWTDIHDDTKTTILEKSGLRKLAHAGGKGSKNSYILVQVGDKPGNVLIQIRSRKLDMRNPLWSWHIWIVEDYPSVKKILRSEVGGNGEVRVDIMSRLIGAFKDPSTTQNYNEDLWETFGMQYQWGRKDPFPATDVVRNDTFYDGNGDIFSFEANAKGIRKNKGLDNPLEAAGSTYTMKASIENPASIVLHESFWNYEMMPFHHVHYFYKKWVFRYPWNRAPLTLAADDDKIDPLVGKTVFDPSPYGFKIMSQNEAITIRYAYYRGPSHPAGLATPLPGTILDGNYLARASGGNEFISAVAQSRNKHAGCYLINSTGGWGGWSSGSNTSDTYRRAVGFTIQPVMDPEHFGAENLTEKDYKKYLPQ